jgi:transposase
MVLDQKTGLPVWYQIMPGNVLDFSTIMNVMSDVAESLDIRIDELVLDAGYMNRDLLETFNIDTKPYIDEDGEEIHQTMIARMPAKNGYPYKQLYHDTKNMYGNAKYEIIRQGHTYFGYRKEVEIFGFREYAYVYVDKDNALELGRKYQLEHEKEYQALKDKDKNWYSVKYGYFVLVSNKKKEPDEMLDDYFGRTKIETIFSIRSLILYLETDSKHQN